MLGGCERNEEGTLYVISANGPEHIVLPETSYPLFVHSQDGQLVVRLPECGDFSKTSSYNYRNVGHSNWGCASQRNFGAMIANPADLTGAPAMENRDAARTAKVIREYRTGSPTLSTYGSIGATPAARGGF
jgi:hypothetical protein